MTTTRRHNGHPLTDEQNRAVDLALRAPRTLRIEAFAGAGKTSTLAAIATAIAFEKGGNGLYAAFNRSIVTDAEGVFPPTTAVRTVHSLAYRAVAAKLPDLRERLATRLNGKRLAHLLGLQANGPFSAEGVGARVLDTLGRFCNSADTEIEPHHVPRRVADRIVAATRTNHPVEAEMLREMASRGITVEGGELAGPATAADRAFLKQNAQAVTELLDPRREIDMMRRAIASIATHLFDAMRGDAKTPLTHDAYLELWALEEPQLDADFILFDEAQDASPVMLRLLAHQACPVFYVGDRYQEIYGWRGAVNALEAVGGTSCRITQSFRFGQPIADLASAILTRDLDADVQIRGFDPIASRVVTDDSGDEPDAILGRSNAAVLAELLRLVDQGARVFLVGGSRDFQWLVESVDRLYRGLPATHPQLVDFQSWSELQAFAETDSGRDLKALIAAVEKHGPGRLTKALKATARTEAEADVVLSTAHRAKGRQWPRVKLLGDFRLKETGKEREDAKRQPWSPEESRIAYVAATRGQLEVDVSACRPLRKLADEFELPETV